MTALFATLTGSPLHRGSGARSRLALASICAAALALSALALAAAPASAATPPNFCPEGSGAGQCNAPSSIADDESSGASRGDIYIADENNQRIDKFDSEGDFLLTFGWGVADGGEELQVCTSSCRNGIFGRHATQTGTPTSVAVDSTAGPSSGDVYVFERLAHRVEKFTSDGEFLLAFGKGVDQGPHHPGDVCKASYLAEGDACGEATAGTGAGQFDASNDVHPLVVDSSGDVWVGDVNRVEKFGPEGEFLSEVALPGAENITSLALDSAGNLYIISSGIAGVQKYEPSSAPFGAPYPLDATGNPRALGLDSASEALFVADEANSGPVSLFQYSSAGTQLESFGTGGVLGHPRGNALAFVSESQRLYVVGFPAAAQIFALPEPGPLPEENGAGAEPIGKTGATLIANVNPEGKPTTCEFQYVDEEHFQSGGFSNSATKTTPTSASVGEDFVEHPCSAPAANLTPNTTYHFRLIAHNENAPPQGVFGEGSTFTTLPPLRVESTYATEVSATGATLGALIDPLGDPTSYRFEYLTQAEYEANLQEGPDGFAGAHEPTRAPVPDASLIVGATGSGDPAIAVEEIPEILHAEASSGAFAPGQLISGAGIPAGTTIAAVEGETLILSKRPTPGKGVSLIAVQPAARHIAGLAPSTGYRYRVVATNSAAPAGLSGPVRSFTTQRPGGSLVLLDNRAWEMVSPIDKNGGAISGIDQGTFLAPVQAAANGEAITYGSPVAFADPAGSPAGNQYLSMRHGEAGWSTANIGIPTNAETVLPALNPPYKSFSADLSRAVLSNGGGGSHGPGLPTPPLPGTEAAPGFGNFYLRENAGPSYRAILTQAQAGTEASLPLLYEDATPDLRHVVFREENKTTEHPQSKGWLYEWSEGHFDPINLLPGKTTPTPTNTGLGDGARGTNEGDLRDLRALSADGSRAVWAAGIVPNGFGPAHNIYLRENIGQPQSALAGGECTEPQAACTVQIDASEGGEAEGGNGTYLASSADDSVIYFADHRRLTSDSTADRRTGESPQLGDLYRFLPDAAAGHRLADLTVDHTDPRGAEVLGVLGASEDGSYLYFVANGVLTATPNARGESASPGGCDTEGAAPGSTCNLYLYHAGETTFVATLAGEDRVLKSDVVSFGAGEGHPTGTWSGVGFRNARVSPDGRHVLFASYRSLTGYDNIAANGSHCGTGQGGEPLPPACPEVFRYAAPTEAALAGELDCLSCNPTGERPLGLSGIPTGTRTYSQEFNGIYQSRSLAAGGRRAFFDSYDALVPQDTNGKLDVYEWEEAGEGGCAESSPSFSNAAAGCLSLISSGTGSESSFFMDASADGSDVFFITGSSLVASDPGSVDLYDARVGGGLPEPPLPAASCQGDACQSAPPAPNDPTPASSTYSGPGNETPARPKKHKKKPKHHKKKAHKKHKRANANRGGLK